MPAEQAGSTSHDAQLSVVLSEFARTMATDFPIQAILDHLIERIVEMLPVSGPGVTLISTGKTPQYIAASDPTALLFEQLQTELDEGPCLLAYTTGEAVEVPNHLDESRFPCFGPPRSGRRHARRVRLPGCATTTGSWARLTCIGTAPGH